MNGRLYRLTPAGGKPNHYTDSYASALAKLPTKDYAVKLKNLEVGETLSVAACTLAADYELWHSQPIFVERVA